MVRISHAGVCAGFVLAPLLLSIGLAHAQTEAGAQTLNGVLASALRTNPDVEGARLGAKAANEDRIQASAGYRPVIDVSGAYGVEQRDEIRAGVFGPVTMRRDLSPSSVTVRATQDLYTGGRRAALSQAAKASAKGARQGLRAIEQEVLLDAINAYSSVWRDRNIVRIRQANVDALTELLDAARKRLKAGEVTRTDVAQSDARLSGGIAALALAESQLEASRADFEEVTGQIAGELTEPQAPEILPRTLDEALRQSELTNPLLLQAQEAVRGAKARIGVERSALLPRLSVVLRYDKGRDDNALYDDVESSSAHLQFSMPLYSGGYDQSRTRQSRINAARAQSEADAKRLETVSAVVKSWNRLAASRRAVLAAGNQVKANEVAVNGIKREQGLGLRTTIDVLDAQQDLAESNIALARVRSDSLVAAYALLAADGALNADTLGLPKDSAEK